MEGAPSPQRVEALNRIRSSRGLAPLESGFSPVQGASTESTRLRGRTGVFGKSWGEIGKKMVNESALSLPVGVVTGLAVSSLGIATVAPAAAGLVTSGLAGGAKEGIKVHSQQTVEKWARIRAEKGVERLWNPLDIIRGLNPDEKQRLGAAIGKGALKGAVFGPVGGAIGGAIGGALAETAVGHAAGAVAEGVRGVANAAGVWKDTWGLPPVPPPRVARPQVTAPVPVEAPVSAPETAPLAPVFEVPVGAPEAVAKIYQDPEFIKGTQEILEKHLNKMTLIQIKP